jgi:hypothetical protein
MVICGNCRNRRTLNDEQLRIVVIVRTALLVVFAKLRKATVSFVMSVCPHATTWLALDGFS